MISTPESSRGCYGDIKRIAVLTHYWPVADANVPCFLEDCGFEVVAIGGICCDTPTAMSRSIQ